MNSGASSFVEQVDLAFYVIIGISAVLMALITFFMIYFVLKYRKEKHPVPAYIPGSVLLETIWIVLPTIISVGMFWVGYIGFENIRTVPEKAFNIEVSARMWSWRFKYPNGKGDKELFVPVDRPVKLIMMSKDVIHSLYIPAFRVKEDVLPGKNTYLWFEAKKTGTYTIYCAEYCGELHSAMLSKVHVLSEEDFDNWYNDSKVPKSLTKTSEANSTSKGLEIIKKNSCMDCHSIDGSTILGTTFKNLYGKKVVVITGGKEREITVDEEYLKRSIVDPKADIVKGTKVKMPSYKDDLTDENIQEIIKYIKSISD